MDWNKISFASESCIWHINFILLFYHHNEYIILSVLVLVHLHVRLHFKTQLEFYSCDWITTLSEQQNNQTLKTVFLHFQRSLASYHKRPFNLYISSGHLWEPFLQAASCSNGYIEGVHLWKLPLYITKSSCNVSPYKKHCHL